MGANPFRPRDSAARRPRRARGRDCRLRSGRLRPPAAMDGPWRCYTHEPRDSSTRHRLRRSAPSDASRPVRLRGDAASSGSRRARPRRGARARDGTRSRLPPPRGARRCARPAIEGTAFGSPGGAGAARSLRLLAERTAPAFAGDRRAAGVWLDVRRLDRSPPGRRSRVARDPRGRGGFDGPTRAVAMRLVRVPGRPPGLDPLSD